MSYQKEEEEKKKKLCILILLFTAHVSVDVYIRKEILHVARYLSVCSMNVKQQ